MINLDKNLLFHGNDYFCDLIGMVTTVPGFGGREISHQRQMIIN